MNILTTYKTAEVAAVIGVHPNTVRLYEEWGLIPAAKRQKNGYRVFTTFHIQQFWLARTAFQIEVLQGGLRKKIVEVVKLSAQGNFDGAILLTREYVADLGLITLDKPRRIANAIYREIIPRELTWTTQSGLVQQLSLIHISEPTRPY